MEWLETRLVPANVAPVATNDSGAVLHDRVLSGSSVLANDSDWNGDPMTPTLVGSTSHGALTLNSNGTYTYTPDAKYVGTDSFTYKVSDGIADSNVATVTINVVNTAPVAGDDSFSVPQDAVLSASVMGNDGDFEGDPLTAILVGGPSHGTLTLSLDGSFTYTPSPSYSGPDTFTYQANDGVAFSIVATVTLGVGAGGLTVRLRGDTDRDGKVDGADEAGKDTWTKAKGAIFAVNHDDDDGDGKPDAIDAEFKNVDGNPAVVPMLTNRTIDGAGDVQDTAPLVISALGAALPAGAKVFLKVGTVEDAQSVLVYGARQAGATAILGGLGSRLPGGAAAAVEADVTALVSADKDVTLGVEGLFFRNVGMEADPRYVFDGEIDFTLELRQGARSRGLRCG